MDRIKRKKNEAQGIVAAFIYISVISLVAIYVTIYSGNQHNVAVRNINHTKAYYMAEGGLIRRIEQLRRTAGAYAGIGSSTTTFTLPDINLIPAASDPAYNPLQFTVVVQTTDLSAQETGFYRIRSRVTNWK